MDPRAALLPPERPLPSGDAAAPASAGDGQPATVRLNSAELFGAAREIQIDHHGAVYRLKQTALGKLILTK